MAYTNRTTVDASFEEAIDATTAALEAEGFGVLCDIDVQATFRENLGEEFQKYRILGACNPPLAHEGLNEEVELGALLPCNIIVYETEDEEVVVSAVDPEQLVAIADNEALDSIASEVNERYGRVIASLAAGPGSTTDT
ncbi:MAG: DUF302 domain-containing protein [Halanaeroarchaeum sp.]